jgi:hypothetical protein
MFYKTKVALLFGNPYADIENCETLFDKNTIVLLVKKEEFRETLTDKKIMFTFLPIGYSVHKLFISLDQFNKWFLKHENL